MLSSSIGPWLLGVAAYCLAGGLAAAELAILWLALHPDVHPDYRAFYIDRSTTCLNRDVPGTYRLGETVSFRSGGGRQSAPLKVCGWSGAAGNGTHSLGETSRLRVRLAGTEAARGLEASLELSPVLKPGTAAQRVLVSVNGVQLVEVILSHPEPRRVAFRIPGSVVGSAQRLEISFDYPDALPTGPMASRTHSRAVRLSSFRLVPLDA